MVFNPDASMVSLFLYDYESEWLLQTKNGGWEKLVYFQAYLDL